MNARKFALVGGASMLGMGITALAIPRLSRSPSEAGLPPLRVEKSYGQYLGLFPLNVFNKVALTAFGLAGILSYFSDQKVGRPVSTYYSRTVFFAMAPLSVLGVIPPTRTLFGLWPLFGGEVIAHGLFAACGAYFGFPPASADASPYPESSGNWIEQERLLA
ncbi:MAG: DUF4383 domain-containing protein [Bdellovibrionia bacterium]